MAGLRQRNYINEARQKWHWVEDDDEVVLFVGSKTKSLSYYKKHGGTRSGLHLISMTKGQGGGSPEVGKVVESFDLTEMSEREFVKVSRKIKKYLNKVVPKLTKISDYLRQEEVLKASKDIRVAIDHLKKVDKDIHEIPDLYNL